MKCLMVLVVVVMSARVGNSIRCYECTSSNNSMCLDLASYDKETLDKFVKLTDCRKGIFTPDNHEFFCRKIVQTIFHKHHDTDVRVTRGCGWLPSKRECYKADNEDHLETVCQCFNDGCNGAGLAGVSALALVAAGVVALRSLV